MKVFIFFPEEKILFSLVWRSDTEKNVKRKKSYEQSSINIWELKPTSLLNSNNNNINIINNKRMNFIISKIWTPKLLQVFVNI